MFQADIKSKPTILLPIEIKARELEAKLLLSTIALQYEYDVIIGEQNALKANLQNMPRGIYIDKGAGSRQEKWFKKIKKHGNVICAWDEEGIVVDEAAYVDYRLSQGAFDSLEIFFCSGKKQKSLIEKAGLLDRTRVLVTGNPRIDMLKLYRRGFNADLVKRIERKYGDMILVNSNFSLVNHFHGKDYKRWWEQGISEKSRSLYDGKTQHKKVIFPKFVELTKSISDNFPDYSVVVRPHPSESIDNWKLLTKSSTNIEVVGQSNAIAWMLASKVIIHHDCTTGVEAYLLGKQTISYRPIEKNDLDEYLPVRVSECFSTVDQIIETISQTVNGEYGAVTNAKDRDSVISCYIQNAFGKDASNAIVEIIHKNNLFEKVKTKNDYSLSHISEQDNAFKKFRDILWKIKNGGMLLREKRYSDSKFKSLTAEEISCLMRKIYSTIGCQSKLKFIKKVARNCFQLGAMR